MHLCRRFTGLTKYSCVILLSGNPQSYREFLIIPERGLSAADGQQFFLMTGYTQPHTAVFLCTDRDQGVAREEDSFHHPSIPARPEVIPLCGCVRLVRLYGALTRQPSCPALWLLGLPNDDAVLNL